MKKILAIVAITGFVACGGDTVDSSATATDSVDRALDSVLQTGDTSALNSIMGDSSSAGGTPDTLR